MAETFDFIIIGAGMMGAAAARHLSATGARIALIGPDEPVNWPNHEGVFRSHYDNGRITRTIDPDPVWARLARRSIERYGEIARESGIDVYTEAGCLIAAPASSADFSELDAVIAARDKLGVEAPFIEPAELAKRFSCFRFPQNYAGVFEPRDAGHINPRALVAAQVALAAKGGVQLIRSEVASVDRGTNGVTVRTVDDGVFETARVLVAAGGFSVAANLLPRPLDLVVKARTVLFAEVAEAQLSRFAGMPSLIGSAPRQEDSYYLLPPIRYPDGKWYLKIGGDPSDIVLSSEADIRAWFRGAGSEAAARHMAELLRAVVPSLPLDSLKWSPCVTTFTRHGYPYIGFAGSDRIAVLTGGNGKAAKSSDEIGRLGAQLLVDGCIEPDVYETDFAVCYR